MLSETPTATTKAGSMPTDEWLHSVRSLTSSKERLIIMQFLSQQDAGVFSSTIAEKTGIKATTLSRMLRDLEDLGFIHGDLAPTERRGRAVRYTLNPARIRTVLKDAAKHLNIKL